MKVYLSLGSNVGDRKANLEKALQLLSQWLDVEQVSSLYQTEPVGYTEQPPFLNAICRVETDLGPLQLLSLIKGIEASLGRVPSFPNAPRPIDVDILFYGDLVIETPELTIPHPGIEERAFVLIPLLEIAPNLLHPVRGDTIRHLTAKVPGKEGVKKVAQPSIEQGTKAWSLP